jgi:uncharacterized protein (TIGR04222 family)
VAVDEPWGVSGPQFLLLFAVLYAAALVPYLLLRLRHRRELGLEWHVVPPLHLYERAALAGGSSRVALTALVALNEGERVRLLDDGRVEPVEHAAGQLHPVERVLVDLVRAAPGLTAGTLVKELGRASEVAAVAGRLEQRGLVLSRAERSAYRRRLLPVGAVLALGLVRLVNGIMLHRPVLFLVILLVAGAAGLLVLLASAPRRSPTGDAVVRRWTEGDLPPDPVLPAWGTSAGPGVLTGAAAGVALLGLPALTGEDPTLLALRAGGAVPAAGGGGDGGGGGGCGGGGCGGGCGG